MVAALEYAEGSGPCPPVLTQKHYIDVFGVEAVMHRPYLYAHEIRQMVTADNIAKAYMSRESYRDKEGHQNYPEWMSKYPQLARILNMTEQLAEDLANA